MARFRFEMVAQERAILPKFKGSTLRGGFGYAFKRFGCFNQQAGDTAKAKECGQHCSLGNTCNFGYLFETRIPTRLGGLPAQTEAPGPFVIEPPDDDRTLFMPGDRLHFDLLLYGRGIEYLPSFVVAFDEMGRLGMGKEHGRFELERVDCLEIGGGANSAKMRQPIIARGRPVRGSSSCEALYFGYQEIQKISAGKVQGSLSKLSQPLVPQSLQPTATSQPTLELRFQTPLRLKSNRDWLREPTFAALIMGTLRRAFLLDAVHCGGDWERNWELAQPLLELSSQVQLLRNETKWIDWDRYSTRQQQKMNLGGLLGRAVYQFPDESSLACLLPVLELARWVHVGKATVFGHGKLTAYLSPAREVVNAPALATTTFSTSRAATAFDFDAGYALASYA
jgi:hypothetical protein